MIDNIGTEGQVRRHGHTDRDPDRAGARRGERTRGRPARLGRRGLAPGRADVRRLRHRIFAASKDANRACLSRMNGKRSSPVLRGPRRGNAPGLPAQTAPPDTNQCRPTSTGISAGHRLSQTPKPWPGFSQRRYISKRSTARPHHALTGRAGLRDGRAQESLRLGLGGRGVVSRRPPPRATTRQPRGRAT
jgi:hypothetical protein